MQDRQLNNVLKKAAASNQKEQKLEILNNNLRSKQSELDELEIQELGLLSKM